MRATMFRRGATFGLCLIVWGLLQTWDTWGWKSIFDSYPIWFGILIVVMAIGSDDWLGMWALTTITTIATPLTILAYMVRDDVYVWEIGPAGSVWMWATAAILTLAIGIFMPEEGSDILSPPPLVRRAVRWAKNVVRETQDHNLMFTRLRPSVMSFGLVAGVGWIPFDLNLSQVFGLVGAAAIIGVIISDWRHPELTRAKVVGIIIAVILILAMIYTPVFTGNGGPRTSI